LAGVKAGIFEVILMKFGVLIKNQRLSLLPSVGWEVSNSHESVAMLCHWQRNPGFGITPAMHHRLVYIHLQA